MLIVGIIVYECVKALIDWATVCVSLAYERQSPLGTHFSFKPTLVSIVD